VAAGADGKPGTDGKVGPAGKDGDALLLNVRLFVLRCLEWLPRAAVDVGDRCVAAGAAGSPGADGKPGVDGKVGPAGKDGDALLLVCLSWSAGIVSGASVLYTRRCRCGRQAGRGRQGRRGRRGRR
jgi:hypothetical protein